MSPPPRRCLAARHRLQPTQFTTQLTTPQKRKFSAVLRSSSKLELEQESDQELAALRSPPASPLKKPMRKWTGHQKQSQEQWEQEILQKHWERMGFFDRSTPFKVWMLDL